MPDFENSKTSIGNLDDKSRKDMFNKFVEAGGEVVKPKKPPIQKSSSPVSRGGSDPRERSRRPSSAGSDIAPGSGSTATSSSQKSYEEELGSFTNRLAIKLKCWFARVTPYRNEEILPGFMHEFSVAGKRALMEFNLVGNDLFGNPAYGPKITKELDKVNPMYVEIIAKGHKAYDTSEIHDLFSPYQNSPEIPVPICRIKTPLYSLFAKLYVIYPYQETYKKAVSLGYDILQKLENKPALIYINKKKHFNSELGRMMGTLYEKIYLLIIRSERKNIPMVSMLMERILGITSDLKIGNRKPGENVPQAEQIDEETEATESEEENSEEDTSEENEEKNLDENLRHGLKLLRSLSIQDLRKKYDTRNEYKDIADSDKALLSFLFFKEFDDEYSVVMTTKKIMIKPAIINGAKMDIRLKLVDLYETSRSSIEQMRIYNDTMNELVKHKKNPGANYIESSKKTSGLEQKRSQQSRNVRITIKEFMDKTSENLKYLHDDIHGAREIVENPDEQLVLDVMEGKKKLNKQTISDCIFDAYSFSSALAARLDAGDLFGGVVELDEQEMAKSFGIMQDENKKMAEDLLNTGSSELEDI